LTVCVCVCARARACVRARERVCAWTESVGVDAALLFGHLGDGAISGDVVEVVLRLGARVSERSGSNTLGRGAEQAVGRQWYP
jgi:hypothetical protein